MVTTQPSGLLVWESDHKPKPPPVPLAKCCTKCGEQKAGRRYGMTCRCNWDYEEIRGGCFICNDCWNEAGGCPWCGCHVEYT